MPDAALTMSKPLTSTLAPQTPFSPLLEMHRGIGGTIVFNMRDRGVTETGQDIRKWDFWKKMERESVVYQRSGDLLRGKLNELIANSYDAIVDKVDSLDTPPEEFNAEVTIETFYQGNNLIVRIVDNGKTVTLDPDGNPVKRYRDPKRHFGSVGAGTAYLKAHLRNPEEDIKWIPLEDGTKTELKLPKKQLPSTFFIKKEEFRMEERDKRALKNITSSFQKDAEIQYFNLLKNRAKELGLSEAGLKRFINEHLEELTNRAPAEKEGEALSNRIKRLGTVNDKMENALKSTIGDLTAIEEADINKMRVDVYKTAAPPSICPRAENIRLLKIYVPEELMSSKGLTSKDHELIVGKTPEGDVVDIYINLEGKPSVDENGKLAGESVFVRLDPEITDDKEIKEKISRLKESLKRQVRSIRFWRDPVGALIEKIKENPEMDEEEKYRLYKLFKEADTDKDSEGAILFSSGEEEFKQFLESSPIARWQLTLKETMSMRYSSNFLLSTSLLTKGKIKKRLDLVLGGSSSLVHEMSHAVLAGRTGGEWIDDEFELADGDLGGMIKYFMEERSDIVGKLNEHQMYGAQKVAFKETLRAKHSNEEAIAFCSDVNIIVDEIVARLTENIDQVNTDYDILDTESETSFGIKSLEIDLLAGAGLIPPWYSPKHIGYEEEEITAEYYLQLAGYCVNRNQHTALAEKILSELGSRMENKTWNPGSTYWSSEDKELWAFSAEPSEKFYLIAKKHIQEIEKKLEQAQRPADAEVFRVFDQKTEETEKVWGQTFIDTALMRADEARRLYAEGKIDSPDILIGAETSWIPKEQRPYIQELLNKLSRLSKEKGLDNFMIIRGKGAGLASVLRKEAGERGVPNSNLIILGDHSILDGKAFDPFREGIDPEKWAFFAGVELPDNFPENNYIRLLEMLSNAVNLWAGKPRPVDTPFMKIVQEGERIYRFILPEVEPMDYDLLKRIYQGQLKAMKAA